MSPMALISTAQLNSLQTVFAFAGCNGLILKFRGQEHSFSRLSGTTVNYQM